ncbi:MAG: DUF933 domain-containing protein, partial [Candidatus Muiribacteriaceae bacterium]
MKIGITGLKYSGKTSLFTLLTGKEVQPGKNEVNIGVAKVPDRRIDELSDIYGPKKTTYANLDLVDIPGIDPDNPNNRGFFEDIRKVDMLLVVLRSFESDMYPNPLNSNDIQRDFELIKDEILLQDMTFVEKRIESLEKQYQKQKTPELQKELETMRKISDLLNDGIFLLDADFDEGEESIIRNYGFFSRKIIMPVINTSEDNAGEELEFLSFSLKIESEIALMPEEDREMFYQDLGIETPALEKLMRGVYEKAGLISFFTVGKDEVRAWTIKDGLNAKSAAGKIHSDLEKGFIRAET